MNKKISTLFTAGLLVAGSLFSNAWAEVIPLSQAKSGETYLLKASKVSTDKGSSFSSQEGWYVGVNAEGKSTLIQEKTTIWEVTVSGASEATRSYKFTSKNGDLTMPYTVMVDGEAKEKSTNEFFALALSSTYEGLSLLRFEDPDTKTIYTFGHDGTNLIKGTTSSDAQVWWDAIELEEVEASEVDDPATTLNALYNKKGFNLTAGEKVESNLFEVENTPIIAVQVPEGGYTLTTEQSNGKDLTIPAGTYFFTDLKLMPNAEPAQSIDPSEVDWLESTVIMVSPTETVENTVNNSKAGQGFKLITASVNDLIFPENTSKYKVGDLPVANACFSVWYDNVSKYSIRLANFYYQADATATDDKELTKCDKAVGLAVLDFTDGTKHLTTIPGDESFAFSFSDIALKDGKDLLYKTKKAAVYNIQFVAGNEDDKDLIGKYLTNGTNESAFNWVAKGLDIADLNLPAFQYTITKVERAAGSKDDADAKYVNVTFTNRETNMSFTAQLFKETVNGEECYSLAFDEDNKIETVTPVTVLRNGYSVKAQDVANFDQYVIVKLIPVEEVSEFAGFYNVPDKSIRTIRFARDKFETSHQWYTAVYNDNGSYNLNYKNANYFAEDVYGAAQFQLIKDTVNVNTISRVYVYYNETTKDVDDVPNGDKLSAYTYQLQYVENGTETGSYMTGAPYSNTQLVAADNANAGKFIIKENADGSVSLLANLEEHIFNGMVAIMNSYQIAIDATPNNDEDYIKYVLGDYVYAYEDEDGDVNIKTYLESDVPDYSWRGEGHVTLRNSTEITGNYISMNEAHEGVLVSNDDEAFYLFETDKDAIVPSFYITKNNGSMIMFNPVDSIPYLVDAQYDEQYQLAKDMTKVIFKEGSISDDREEITTTVKGEERVLAEEADNVSKWAGLDRFKFQIIENEEGTYNIRQVAAIEESNVVKTAYLASLNEKLYFTTNPDLAMDIIVETTEGPTANETIADEAEGVQVIAGNGAVTIQGAAGKTVVITNILGKAVANTTLTSDNQTINVPAGIVVVTVDGEAVKAIVK